MRRVAPVALLLVLVPFLAGCLRVQVSMGISADDRVSGQIVAATVPTDENDGGPQLTPPESLAGKVRVEPYKRDGYVGSQAYFTDLSFGDVQQLGAMNEQAAGQFQLELRRSGDIVTLDGKIDLSDVPTQGTDVQFTVAFPTRVATTNGTREGDSIVSWKLAPGDASRLEAEVRYPDPSTRSFAGWAGIAAGVALGVAVVVGALAWLARNREAPIGSGRRDSSAPPNDDARV
nr:DUF3153 domain-containing protein [Rhodococcus sp. HNM0569]